MLLDADRTRIRHIIEAAQEAMSFARGVRFEDAIRNRQLQLSLVRCLEIIGEAASRISPSMRERCREVPWQDMIGMRNRIVHAYFDIDFGTVWNTVQSELPVLVSMLERMGSNDLPT